MTAGTVALIVVCTANGGVSVAPCADVAGVGYGPTTQNAYLLDQYQGAFYEQATAAFDATVGAQFFAVGLIGVVGAFFIGLGVRVVLKPLGLIP